MLPIGLNHMTVPQMSARDVFALAASIGCTGVELRNDLDRPLFDGQTPQAIGQAAKDHNLRILGLAEVKAFNADPKASQAAAVDLIATAALCGAEGVALIPLVSSAQSSRDEQRAALHVALDILQPILQDHGMRGLIEPLGFATSSLRFKQDAVAVLDAMDRPDCFGLVHDTFHHHLAGEEVLYPDLTALIHISGVDDPTPTSIEMTDAHRVLVGPNDRLGNIAQLQAFVQAGYDGPASFEAFAPAVHDMTDPAAALAGSIAFITQHLTADAAELA
jgi:2-keto-myo-inositol isomerase